MSERRLRLFLALDLPAAVRSRLATQRERLIADHPRLRPVASEALHVTLIFLGPTDPASVGDLERHAQTARERSAGGLVLVPVGLVGLPPRRARAIALDLDDRDGAVADLRRDLVGRLAEAGLHEPERRPYRPHVTLARVGGADRPSGGLDAGELPEPFAPTALTLYRSETAPGGPRYDALWSLRLD